MDIVEHRKKDTTVYKFNGIDYYTRSEAEAAKKQYEADQAKQKEADRAMELNEQQDRFMKGAVRDSNGKLTYQIPDDETDMSVWNKGDWELYKGKDGKFYTYPSKKSGFNSVAENRYGMETENKTPNAMEGDARYQKPEEPKPLTWEAVKSMNDGDPAKIAEYMNNNPGYVPGNATKNGMAEFGYQQGPDGKWMSNEDAAVAKNPEEAAKVAQIAENADKAEDENNAANSEAGKALESELSNDDGKKDKKQSGWSKYWKNIAFGNDNGSIKEAKNKAEKEKKYEEFLQKDPSLVKAIFGKDSGLNLGERALRLGEMLATLGANTINGAVAGFNRQAAPKTVVGRYASKYNEAMDKQYNRVQEKFDEQQKVKNEVAKITERYKQMPEFKNMDDETINKIATASWNGEQVSKEEAAKRWWPNASAEEADAYYNAYQTVMQSNDTGRKNKEENLNIQSKGLANALQAADNEEKLEQYINTIDTNIRELTDMEKSVRADDQDSYFKYINSYLGYLKGIQSQSTNDEAHRGSNVNVSATAGGNIKVVKAEVTASGGYENGSSEGQQMATDLLALSNLPHAEVSASNYKKYLSEYSKQIADSIHDQIKDLERAKDAAQQRLNKMRKINGNDKSVNDGIVKAPHMKQWLVREDGTKIALNPNDSVYATKKTITSEKDDGQDVVQMKEEDPVIVYQKRLGYTGGNINKDFDYYLNKLRG